MFHIERHSLKEALAPAAGPPTPPLGFTLSPAPASPASSLPPLVWLQVFHCHFNSNFFPLFLEHLLSDHISLSTGSFLLGEWVPGQAGRTEACTPEPLAPLQTQPPLQVARIYAGVALPASSPVFQKKGWSLCGFEGAGLP